MSNTVNIQINILGNAYQKINNISKGFKGLENTVVKTAKKVSKLSFVPDAFMRGSETFRNFQQSLADLSAITGIAGKNLDNLSKAARTVGKSSGLGATQAAVAFKLLASQISVDKIGVDGLKELHKQTILLSQAGGIGLTTAANAMAGAINQFGLEAKDAARVVNVLAAATKEGAAVSELSMAFKMAAGTAAGAGVSLESTVGAIETLSKTGLKGAEAGTALRNILLKMQTQLGMDISGDGLSKGLKSLQKELGNTTFLTKTFGVENVNAAQFLIKNSALFDEVTQKVTGTNAAFEQAKIRTNTFNHQMKVGRAMIDDFKISVFSAINSVMPYSGLVVQMGADIIEMAPALMEFGNTAVKAGEGVMWLTKMENLQNVGNGIKSIGTGIYNTVMKAGQAIMWLTKAQNWQTIASKAQAVWTGIVTAAQWAFNAAMAVNPIVWIVIAIAALVAAFVLAYQKIGWFRGMVNAAWEILKIFGKSLFNLVIMPFKVLWAIVKGVTVALYKVFTGDFSGAWEAIKGAGKSIYQSAKDVVTPWKDAGNAVDAYKKGVDEVNKKKVAAKAPEISETKGSGVPNTSSITAQGNEEVTATKTNITTGGTKHTKINVQIGVVKSADTINFEGVKEGLEGIEEKVTEVLFNAIAPISKMVIR